MKIAKLLLVFLIPFVLHGQPRDVFADAWFQKDLLFMFGNQRVVIKPTYQSNGSHQWTVFDSVTNITITKKLVTPYANRIVRQNYFANEKSIIRIDQYMAGKRLHISAYVFDVYGNIVLRKSLLDSLTQEQKVLAAPLYVQQSHDDHTFSLVQAMVLKDEQASILHLRFDATLQLVTTNQFTVPFDDQVVDMFSPLVNNEGAIAICIADKNDSYKLGSALIFYVKQSAGKPLQTVQFNFERKKIKGLNLQLVGDTIFFSTFFGVAPRKQEVVGRIDGGFTLNTLEKKAVKETWFNHTEKK